MASTVVAAAPRVQFDPPAESNVPTPIPQRTRQRIRAEYRPGCSLSGLARRHGVSLPSVYRILGRLHRRRMTPRYTEIHSREAVRMYSEGMAPREISRAMRQLFNMRRGPSGYWIHEQLRRYGVPSRTRAQAQSVMRCRRAGFRSVAALRRRAVWLRQVGRMTQAQIAAELHVSQAAISLWLRTAGMHGRLPRRVES